MPPLFYLLLLIGCFIFGPLTLFYCAAKKKRPLRKAGKSCESLLVDRSIMRTATPSKKLAHSKILRPKAAQKEDSAPKKKKVVVEKVKDSKDDQKQTAGTTGDTEKSKEKSSPKKPNSKPSPIPAKKEVAKKPNTTTKTNDAKKKENLTEPTQNDTDNDTGGRSDKTQSSHENLEHDSE